MDLGTKDTVAFKICRQILDHIYGNEQEFDGSDFLCVHKTFTSIGGSWEDVVNGDPKSLHLLMDVLAAFVKVYGTLEE